MNEDELIKKPLQDDKLRGINGQQIRTFECNVDVTGWLEGDMDNWPPRIQDGIMAAVERKAAEVKLPLAIVHSGCYHDRDHGYYLHIILSEVVAMPAVGKMH